VLPRVNPLLPPPVAPPEHVEPAVAPWRAGLTALLDLAFPPFCAVCRGRLGEGRRDPLCGGCWGRVRRLAPPWCHVCGLALGQFATGHAPALGVEAAHLRCGPCRSQPPAFTYARSAARYEDPLREALRAFKFAGRRALAAPLADLIIEMPSCLAVAAPDLLVPVPLYPRRERERGFNQALLLARRLSRAWNVPVRADVLTRTAATRPQTDLTAAERRANVRHAFALRRPDLVTGRHVVVVDDILTTGSTANACALRLCEAGAAVVGVITVARAG
jgi:ComF family protein